MSSHRQELVAVSGQPITSDSGIPFALHEYVQDWLDAGHRSILALVLRTRTEDQWRELGRQLVERLVTTGGELGLFVNGTTIPVETVLPWIRSLTEDQAIGTAVLSVDTLPHPTKNELRTINIRWMSLHPALSSAWLGSLWNDLSSNIFHVGADLLLGVFPDSLSLLSSLQHNVEFNTFLEYLRLAEAWLIPMDGDIGFFIGVPSNSIPQEEM